MKSLCTLDGFDMHWSSTEDIKGLGELTNLRYLRLSISNSAISKTAGADALVSSIGMLHDLRYLCIHGNAIDTNGWLASLSDPTRHIKVFELNWAISRIPKWICCLQCLYRLEFDVKETSTDELHALGKLPSLACLSLYVFKSKDVVFIISTGLFPPLENFKCSTSWDVTANLAFEAGAMPQLRRLELGFSESCWGGTAPLGLEHLLSLEHITIFLSCY
jgi:hypothetical protein